jgi:hypothetical protein
MIRLLSLCSLFILLGLAHASSQQGILKSPDDFLPHDLGSRFTPHHQLIEYFRYVDGLSDKMQIVEYGQTYELRPLIAAIISSPANMKRIEAIRQNNLRRTGLLEGDPANEDIAIVYLSYTVHGNEAAGAESSMAVLYDLIKGGAPYDSWLENTVVIIDPTLNPDGYNRYSQWSNSVSAVPNNPNPGTREHSEPWPGGRSNHYYFDLNRDWAWQSQKESRDRIAFYLQWMPHVHADIHEMGAESPYYFPPAAQPYHKQVTPWQAAFQIEIGKNHATHFDRNGWLYYSRERFDLFYPSYGDTYPTFAGAIGMTYEQGGGGFANRAVLLENGDTLTLYDRVAHHREASLSTIEVSARNAAQLVEEFKLYFDQSISNPPGTNKSYVIKGTNHPGRVADFLELLRRQGITYGRVGAEQKGIKGLSYLTGESGSFSAEQGDYVIPAAQPRGVLAHVLFEPEGYMSDSMTYDITAWCLPMAFGLDMYATESLIKAEPLAFSTGVNVSLAGKPYAYALEWGSVPSAKALAVLQASGIVARYSLFPFKVEDVDYPAGTVLMMRGDNRHHPGFDEVIRQAAQATMVPVTAIRTGFVDSGKDFGSNDYIQVRRPEVLALAGEKVRSLHVGEVWHFFEEELKWPVHLVNVEDLSDTPLSAYNVIILTPGSYSLSDAMKDRINDWVDAGGRLIAVGSAIGQVADRDDFVENKREDEGSAREDKEGHIHHPQAYSAGERASISEDIPGTIFETTMDQTNPLAFGLGKAYWTLRTSPSQYSWLKDEGNALYLDDAPRHYGFVGYKALESTRNTLVAGVQQQGSGSAVYLPDNPLFRSFWNSGKVLFANAIYF